MSLIFSLVVLGVLIGIYFVPAIVANANHKRNTGAILILNLLLGWTIIGWVVALVWAVMVDSGPQETRGVPSVAEQVALLRQDKEVPL